MYEPDRKDIGYNLDDKLPFYSNQHIVGLILKKSETADYSMFRTCILTLLNVETYPVKQLQNKDAQVLKRVCG